MTRLSHYFDVNFVSAGVRNSVDNPTNFVELTSGCCLRVSSRSAKKRPLREPFRQRFTPLPLHVLAYVVFDGIHYASRDFARVGQWKNFLHVTTHSGRGIVDVSRRNGLSRAASVDVISLPWCYTPLGASFFGGSVAEMWLSEYVISLAMDPRDIAEQIAAAGGIITLPELPVTRRLVGELRWDGRQRMLWFAAFGDSVRDAHAIAFDAIEIQPTGVCFSDRGRIAGFLSPIEQTKVEDPEDYRVAWRLWQEVLPVRQKLIDSAFAGLATYSSSGPFPDGMPIPPREGARGRGVAEKNLRAI